MSREGNTATPFWKTVGWILRHARLRSRARSKHQQRLMNQRAGKDHAFNWGCVGTVFMLIFALVLNGMAAWFVSKVSETVVRLQLEREGKVAMSPWFYQRLASEHHAMQQIVQELDRLKTEKREAEARQDQAAMQRATENLAAKQRQERRVDRGIRRALGGETWVAGAKMGSTLRLEHEKLRAHYAKNSLAGFSPISHEAKRLTPATAAGTMALTIGSVVLLVWFIMIAFQGEGLDIDFQRRRHPMWEWLLSHPVKPGAVFLAEMLSPLAVNPMFLGAPAFWIGLFWCAYSSVAGALVAGLLAGIPMAVAASCVSKAMEVSAMLRLPMRTRGAVLGIMSWMGYAAMVGIIILSFTEGFQEMAVRVVKPLLETFSLPMLGWLLGVQGLGEPSLWKGVLACWLVGGGIAACAVWFSARATQAGLSGAFDSRAETPAGLDRLTRWRLITDAVQRKEMLWFMRDRGALVQVFLIPMSMSATQLFNLRGFFDLAAQSWHAISGAAVLFGTYFLFILGPRSLISEGPALWITLTWPRGLEDLLKMKARVWWLCSSVLVGLVLLIAAVIFPADAWRIGLIAVGWVLFSGSLAEKTVTLVQAASSSGEVEPVPRGRQWAATLGTFTFAIGVLSQQWQVAVTGIVFSWLTSAAMWQNFRARLPYLFDPWSERLPKPPTLMHSMIGASAMMEAMAITLGLSLVLTDKDKLVQAQAIGHGVAGFLTLLVGHLWLRGQGVPARSIWRWCAGAMATPLARLKRTSLHVAIGLVCGLGLALLAEGWLWLMQLVPVLDDALQRLPQHLANHPTERAWMIALAVVCAPPAEEFLFRGMLYRALDREWGGWKAVWGSAAFFAIYHPPILWVPTLLLGALNAWLFRRTNCLETCIAAHMVYNAVVVLV